jgi:hypothetical protein
MNGGPRRRFAERRRDAGRTTVRRSKRRILRAIAAACLWLAGDSAARIVASAAEPWSRPTPIGSAPRTVGLGVDAARTTSQLPRALGRGPTPYAAPGLPQPLPRPAQRIPAYVDGVPRVAPVAAFGAIDDTPVGPRALANPADSLPPDGELLASADNELLRWPVDPPLGYAGRSSILPLETQENSHFVPMEDRWRIGFPEWDRYDRGNPANFEYPYVPGSLWDPYHQNVLKGDYPIFGQNTFLAITAVENLLIEARQTPTPTSPFESTGSPGQEEFFGDPDQFFVNNNLSLTTELNHGNGPFKPADWRLRVTQIYNMNHLVADELGVVNPDVRRGTARFRQDYALEEYFLETKLADLSPDYDFLSVRAGSQFFSSDFKGFIFSDTNRGVRLFGTRNANRDQFNLMWLDQTEKDTNSLLNTWDDRHQNTVIANYYRQDFGFPGYTAQVSYHYNRDAPSFKFNDNDFLVRPDPVGVFAPHEVNAHYLGFAGDGHIERVNISHAAYWVTGEDELNPIAGRDVEISAWMAALELSYDRDWMRFRTSYFFASGDNDPNDEEATGFDTIFDNPQFAGGGNSFWQRQQIGLFGVNLTQRNSLVADLRSSKFQGQTNFVNPGLHLINFGVDADITPRFRIVNNVNVLWFAQTETLEVFTFQADVDPFIGTDLSTGFEYRPILHNNILFEGGFAILLPGEGFDDLYAQYRRDADPLVQVFINAILTY